LYDLLLRGGRIIDPASGRDAVGDVAFKDGKIAAMADTISERAKFIHDVAGCIVTPGLIDLHAHVYHLGTSLGVEPDALAAVSGVTTLVDAGSAGAGIFAGFRHHVIERVQTRILSFLNISFPGIYGFHARINIGEAKDLGLLNFDECVRVAREHSDLIVGVKLRVGANTSAGEAPMDIALAAAEELSLPLMTHIDRPPPTIQSVVSRLRTGDILTHCSRPIPNAPVHPDGSLRDEYSAARARGVIFDVGHGSGSFGFKTARALLAAGFMPDTISSDVHTRSIDGPAFNLLVTMSKFLNLGVDVVDIIRMTTIAPARAINQPNLGHLGSGAIGDATVLSVEDGAFTYNDVLGETITGNRRFAVMARVVGGELIPKTS
jgi:dihydroorotase